MLLRRGVARRHNQVSLCVTAYVGVRVAVCVAGYDAS